MDRDFASSPSDEDIGQMFGSEDENTRRAALKLAYERYLHYLYYIAGTFVEKDAVEDVVQEAMANILQRDSKPVFKLKPWLSAIVANMARKKGKSKGSGPTTVPIDSVPEPSGPIPSPDETVRTQKASLLLLQLIERKLSCLQSEVARYCYKNFCVEACRPSSKELANKFGRTENNIDVILSRIRKKLREAAERRGWDDVVKISPVVFKRKGS